MGLKDLSTRVVGPTGCGEASGEDSPGQRLVLLWEVTFFGVFSVGVAVFKQGGPIRDGGGPSPSGLSRYYQASSPGYSLGVVQVLVDGEGILCLRFISKVAVVLAQEIGLLGGIGSALGLHILWRVPLL